MTPESGTYWMGPDGDVYRATLVCDDTIRLVCVKSQKPGFIGNVWMRHDVFGSTVFTEVVPNGADYMIKNEDEDGSLYVDKYNHSYIKVGRGINSRILNLWAGGTVWSCGADQLKPTGKRLKTIHLSRPTDPGTIYTNIVTKERFIVVDRNGKLLLTRLVGNFPYYSERSLFDNDELDFYPDAHKAPYLGLVYRMGNSIYLSGWHKDGKLKLYRLLGFGQPILDTDAAQDMTYLGRFESIETI